MVVEVGDKIHVIERRMFEHDVRRHFFGEVDAADGTTLRLTGYLFVFDSGSSAYIRADAPRTRIISLTSSGLVINVAPRDTVVEDVRYVEDSHNRLAVTDGGAFRLIINEFGRSR